MREKPGYRDILEDILQWSGGKRWLTATEAAAYCGIDRRTAVKKFGIKDGIAAPILARRLRERSA